MKKLNLLILILCFSLIVNAQKVLMEETVKELGIETQGPNLEHFTHLYFDYGFVVGKPEGKGAEINYGSSHTFTAGIRYKRKISDLYAIGFDINYHYMVFNLLQDSTKKLVPNNLIHDKEKLIFHNLGLELYNRFNFGRRGNIVGKFIDIGAYGYWAFSRKHYILDKTHNSIYLADNEETTYTGLDYATWYNYGVRTRLGFNRYVISATYRLSDLFNDKFHNAQYDCELPRFTVGVQIGIHK